MICLLCAWPSLFTRPPFEDMRSASLSDHDDAGHSASSWRDVPPFSSFQKQHTKPGTPLSQSPRPAHSPERNASARRLATIGCASTPPKSPLLVPLRPPLAPFRHRGFHQLSVEPIHARLPSTGTGLQGAQWQAFYGYSSLSRKPRPASDGALGTTRFFQIREGSPKKRPFCARAWVPPGRKQPAEDEAQDRQAG